MTTLDRATVVINETYSDEYVKTHMTPRKVAQALADAGILAPEPTIIRTPAELEALHPDTVVLPHGHLFPETAASLLYMFKDPFAEEYIDIPLPAVVIASGAHVRACRQALEGEPA